MKKPSRKEKIVDFLVNNPGTHKTSEIAEALDLSVSNASNVLGELTTEGRITKIRGGTYSGNDEGSAIDVQKELSKARKKFSSDARSAESNEQTINTLLNTYDEVLAIFQVWVLQNIASQEINFDKQLLFIENFKWLTLIVDKLMKRWNLEHHGYDTNTRQAQEDAKAKTEEREKAALENAPIEDKIVVVGHYQEGMQEILRSLPKKELEDSEV